MPRLLFLPLLLALAACGSDYDADEAYPDEAYPDDPYADGAYADDSYPPAGAEQQSMQPTADGGRRVAIVDRGLQMPRGTQVIPEGWTLDQNLATDPNTGQPMSQTLEVRGPRGELIRNLGIANYAPMMGTDFEGAWRRLAQQGLGEVQSPSLGRMQRSATMEGLDVYRRATDLARRKGMRVEALEAPVQGSRRGQAMRGVVYVMRWTSPQFAGAGTVQASAVLSPADRLAETLRTNAQMANSYRPNPAYEQRMEQITQANIQRQQTQSRQRMANSWAQHRQRMANRQAQFDAHQQSMRDLSAINDQQFQSWQAQQRSNDEMHRRTINGINGTVDLYDANTGQSTYGVESGYDSYWTDPSGTVVGTEGYDNPDPMQYNQATDYDDLYDQGDGW